MDLDAEKQPEEEQQKGSKWLKYRCFSRSQKPRHPMRVMVCVVSTKKNKRQCNLNMMKYNMNLQVESKRTQLLKHPLVYKLIEDKWSRYGRGLFYTELVFHVVFVIFLMAFSLTLLNPFSPTCTYYNKMFCLCC